MDDPRKDIRESARFLEVGALVCCIIFASAWTLALAAGSFLGDKLSWALGGYGLGLAYASAILLIARFVITPPTRDT